MHIRNIREAKIKKTAVGLQLGSTYKEILHTVPMTVLLYKYWQGVATFQLVKANPLQDFEYQSRLWPVLQPEAGADPVPVLPYQGGQPTQASSSCWSGQSPDSWNWRCTTASYTLLMLCRDTAETFLPCWLQTAAQAIQSSQHSKTTWTREPPNHSSSSQRSCFSICSITVRRII